MWRDTVRRWLLRRWYDQRGSHWLLTPLAWLFSGITALRRWCYRHGLLQTAVLPVPVIVVGNITVGGSGKTPFVIWLAQALKDAGYHPGIITRGYGGEARRWPLPVTSGSDPRQVGDEAVLLARRSGVPVAADPDRVRAAQLLIDRFSVNVVVSDDGLQHYRLPRAAEIIMLDGARGLGNGWRLPAGPLRESPARLQEADFIICKAAGTGMSSMPTGTLGMQLRMEEAVQLVNGVRMPMQAFSGKHVHAVAGIGHPEQFFTALEAMGLLVDGRPLPDHAKFTEADLRFEGDEAVLMTEKDAVKCHAMHLPRHWYVSATAHFADADANRILGYLRKRLGEHGVQPEAVR